MDFSGTSDCRGHIFFDNNFEEKENIIIKKEET